jgi:hypothetical protein
MTDEELKGIVSGIAAFSFSDEVIGQASKYGVGVIRQAGEGIEMDAQNLKAY